jgi:hypothetical protein
VNFVEKSLRPPRPEWYRLTVRGGTRFERNRDKIMRIKALAVILVLVVSATLFVQMRKDNRADAAAKNCYSDAQGPSAPTICN